MLIKDIFAAPIEERIEPIVKVADRSNITLRRELANLVVTPQWEHHIHSVLDAYSDAADREQEEGIGIWISGFFGSGKSLLMKVLGILLEGGDLQGKQAHEVFLERLPPSSADVNDIKHFLEVCRRKITTTATGRNIHAMVGTSDDGLPLIVFKLFAEKQGYTQNWSFAWAIEYQIDELDESESFRRRACELTGMEWEDIAIDPEFYLEALYQAASATLPSRFANADSVARAVEQINRNGVDAKRVITRFRRWCEARDAEGRRHKLFLQLDELGQWIGAGNANDRTMQVQALVEEAAQAGGGRIWIAVTAHGDIQALQQNVQQESYAKIIGRFQQKCRLSNEDITTVVEERVLRKTQEARTELTRRFSARAGEIADLGRLERPQRVYPPPTLENFALFYPYLPWTVNVIPDVVKGIAQAAKRDEALTGSNRNMIAVVQGALLEASGPLASQLGRLISLGDLYGQLSSDVSVETKTDLARVASTVEEATPFTSQVAQALFLLGEAEYIPTTLENVTLAVVNSLDANLAVLRNRVREELRRLMDAGYAKQVGDQYVFLNTQQRSFQDKVRARQDELMAQPYDLSQRLRLFESDNALRFERGSLLDREIPLQLELDGRIFRNQSGAQVKVAILSPLQRALDPQISDDTIMRQRSAQASNTILLRLGEVEGFRAGLALAVATDEVADASLSGGREGNPEREVAQQAKQLDVPELRTTFIRLLGQSVRSGTIFFGGNTYQLAGGNNAGDAVRATLSQILPTIYPRFSDVPQRIVNEQTAVRAALQNNASNPDLQALGVFKSDGTLNENHLLLSTLRARLPLATDQLALNAGDLRRTFEEPPYGWDGNVIKVGLALLLRASACRLLDASQPVTDPANPRTEELLTKENLFRTIRVQGIQSDITMAELIEIRPLMQQILGTPASTALVASTLHNILGEALTRLATKAQEVAAWAVVAQCPLPLLFTSGQSAVQELLNIGMPALRLRTFREQREKLSEFGELVTTLEAFRSQQGEQFITLRNFYIGMVNANLALPPVRRFLDDYLTLEQERTLVESSRWQELVQAYNAARRAVDEQIATWRNEADQQLAGLEDALTRAVSAVGVPEEAVSDEVSRLSELYAKVRNRLSRGVNNLADGQELLRDMQFGTMEKEMRLRELRERYDPVDKRAIRLAWRELAGGPVTLSSLDELPALMARLRDQVEAALAGNATVTIE